MALLGTMISGATTLQNVAEGGLDRLLGKDDNDEEAGALEEETDSDGDEDDDERDRDWVLFKPRNPSRKSAWVAVHLMYAWEAFLTLLPWPADALVRALLPFTQYVKVATCRQLLRRMKLGGQHVKLRFGRVSKKWVLRQWLMNVFTAGLHGVFNGDGTDAYLDRNLTWDYAKDSSRKGQWVLFNAKAPSRFKRLAATVVPFYIQAFGIVLSVISIPSWSVAPDVDNITLSVTGGTHIIGMAIPLGDDPFPNGLFFGICIFMLGCIIVLCFHCLKVYAKLNFTYWQQKASAIIIEDRRVILAGTFDDYQRNYFRPQCTKPQKEEVHTGTYIDRHMRWLFNFSDYKVEPATPRPETLVDEDGNARVKTFEEAQQVEVTLQRGVAAPNPYLIDPIVVKKRMMEEQVDRLQRLQEERTEAIEEQKKALAKLREQCNKESKGKWTYEWCSITNTKDCTVWNEEMNRDDYYRAVLHVLMCFSQGIYLKRRKKSYRIFNCSNPWLSRLVGWDGKKIRLTDLHAFMKAMGYEKWEDPVQVAKKKAAAKAAQAAALEARRIEEKEERRLKALGQVSTAKKKKEKEKQSEDVGARTRPEGGKAGRVPGNGSEESCLDEEDADEAPDEGLDAQEDEDLAPPGWSLPRNPKAENLWFVGAVKLRAEARNMKMTISPVLDAILEESKQREEREKNTLKLLKKQIKRAEKDKRRQERAERNKQREANGNMEAIEEDSEDEDEDEDEDQKKDASTVVSKEDEDEEDSVQAPKGGPRPPLFDLDVDDLAANHWVIKPLFSISMKGTSAAVTFDSTNSPPQIVFKKRKYSVVWLSPLEKVQEVARENKPLKLKDLEEKVGAPVTLQDDTMFENPEGDIFKYEKVPHVDMSRIQPPPGGPTDLSRLLHAINNEILINRQRTLVDRHLFVLVKCLKMIQMQERFNREEHYIASLLEQNVYSLEILSTSNEIAAFGVRHVDEYIKVVKSPVGSELDNEYVREVCLNSQKYNVEWVEDDCLKAIMAPSQRATTRNVEESEIEIVSVDPTRDGIVELRDGTRFRNPTVGSDVDQFLRLREVLRLIQFPKIISSLPGKHGKGRHFDLDVCDPRSDLLKTKEEIEDS